MYNFERNQMSIGKFCSNLILTTNLSNTEILNAVKEQYPEAKTSIACIAWYKSDLRKKKLIPARGQAKVIPMTLTDEEFAADFTV